MEKKEVSKEKKPSQNQLRQTSWELGKYYPVPFKADYINFFMVHPRLGYVNWHILESSVETFKSQHREDFSSAQIVVRIYDVTDILFNGFNAHMFFDIHINTHSGNYYLNIERTGRDYLAEIGFLFGDGMFHYLVRSNTTFFDRDRPSGRYQISGLFVAGAINRIFPVENIFDAPIYERMNRELKGIKRKEILSVAAVFICLDHAASSSALDTFVSNLSQKIRNFGVDVRLFTPALENTDKIGDVSLMEKIELLTEQTFRELSAVHKKRPFHILHCHDWYSSEVGVMAAKKMQLPFILNLHSTEHERSQGYSTHHLSSVICECERRGVHEAKLVIVPHSSTRQQVINLYDVSPDKIVIIPDVLTERAPQVIPDPSEIKGRFGLKQDAPVVLFAGEMSHAAGADLLMEALPTVCRNHKTAQFVLAGEGPLKGELEAKAGHSGIGHRCRFLGDVSSHAFEDLLIASDFIVIPARTWQDGGLAQMAVDSGKAVLTTHQAGVKCVVHGENGLLTYDNPGSIVWGIQELLANPLQGSMLRLVAKKKADEGPSLENIAAEHYIYYEILLKQIQGDLHA